MPICKVAGFHVDNPVSVKFTAATAKIVVQILSKLGIYSNWIYYGSDVKHGLTRSQMVSLVRMYFEIGIYTKYSEEDQVTVTIDLNMCRLGGYLELDSTTRYTPIMRDGIPIEMQLLITSYILTFAGYPPVDLPITNGRQDCYTHKLNESEYSFYKYWVAPQCISAYHYMLFGQGVDPEFSKRFSLFLYVPISIRINWDKFMRIFPELKRYKNVIERHMYLLQSSLNCLEIDPDSDAAVEDNDEVDSLCDLPIGNECGL